MVDESKDVSKKKEESVVVRCMHNDDIWEEFTTADGLDDDSLWRTIKQLSTCNTVFIMCLGQEQQI